MLYTRGRNQPFDWRTSQTVMLAVVRASIYVALVAALNFYFLKSAAYLAVLKPLLLDAHLPIL